MHGIENILMHCVDLKTKAVSQSGKLILEYGEIPAELGDVHQHYHCEHILHNALSYLNNVGVALSADAAYLCKNANGVFADNGNNCFHKKPSFPCKAELHSEIFCGLSRKYQSGSAFAAPLM